jgi:6-phosphogluconolactonase (cycloisomerase 2 family)
VCGPGSNNGGGSFNDLFFYHGSSGANNTLNTASVTATTFQILPGISTDVGQSIVGSVVIVNKKFLYLPDQNGSGGVMAFSINRTSGALTAIPGSPFAVAPSQITTLAADPDANGGRFLFAADFTSGDLLVFTIDATTGALTPVTGSPFANPGFEANSLTVDGTGHYLYATAGTTTGEVDGFLIDQTTGALSTIAGSPFFLFSSQVEVDPAGTFLLSVDGGSSQIDVVPIEAGTGTLLTGSMASYPTVNPVDGIVMHPTGNFVYAFGGHVPLEGFQFTAGVLTELTGSPFVSLSFLTDCQFDQAGTHLFGIKIPSSSVGVYIVDPTTGAATAPIPDPGIIASPYFAATN